MDNAFKDLQHQLAKSVKLVRVAAGLTQEALAHRAGIERSQVSQIERGIANPSLRTLLNIANALGMDLAGLLSGNAGLIELFTKSTKG